jgi:hypothetical protein
MMTVWLGVAIGAAVGIGYAVSRNNRRHRHDRWTSAKDISRRVSQQSGDLAARSREIIDRAQKIYEEGRKIVDDATELWSHGRKLVRA